MGYILLMQTVVELPSYIAKASRLMSKEERSAVIDLVASNPDCGDVIVGTGGVRKVRIAQKGKGKSKKNCHQGIGATVGPIRRLNHG